MLRTVSINSDNKQVRYKMDRYILHTVFLLITLLFIIAITCYHIQDIGQNKKNRFVVLI